MPGGSGTRARVCRAAFQGTARFVTRIKVVYWALMSVLGALTFFLLAAGARLLRWRLGGDKPDGGGPGTGG